jgi:hypothetical protein
MWVLKFKNPRTTSVAREKASTTVIAVIRGAVNGKQIEMEFMNLIGTDGWKWHARQVADDKFLMRFPTAKMALQWSNLKNLTKANKMMKKMGRSTFQTHLMNLILTVTLSQFEFSN